MRPAISKLGAVLALIVCAPPLADQAPAQAAFESWLRCRDVGACRGAGGEVSVYF
jgi:hypothetical protein